MKFFQRMGATVVVRIENGQATMVKGRIRSAGLRDVAAICRDGGVTKGEIWVNAVERVTYSSEIPDSLHQRLRNAVLDSIQR